MTSTWADAAATLPTVQASDAARPRAVPATHNSSATPTACRQPSRPAGEQQPHQVDEQQQLCAPATTSPTS